MQRRHIEAISIRKHFGNFGYDGTREAEPKNHYSPEQGRWDSENSNDVLAEITKTGAFCFQSLFYTFTARFENPPSQQHLQHK